MFYSFLLTFTLHSTPAFVTHPASVMFVPGLSEAETVRLLDFILFGHASTQTTRAPLAKKRNTVRRRTPNRGTPTLPENGFSESNNRFFATIVLRKRPVIVRHPSPPAASLIRRRPMTTDVAGDTKFPVGLCYLVGVAPSMRGAAILELGSYPTVNSLLASWVFNPSKIHLTAQEDGLYHATITPGACSIPFVLGHGHWRVGADNDFPTLPPRNPRVDMGPPPQPPHGPRISNNNAQYKRATRFDQ